MKWQPIKSAPLDTKILVTDGGSVHLATLVSSWVFSEAPKINIAAGLGQAAQCGAYTNKPFKPTHWHATPKLPSVKP